MPLNRRRRELFSKGGWVGGENERHSRAARGGSTRRQRRAPCCDSQHRAKPEAQVLKGKGVEQKDTSSSSGSWRPGNSYPRWREDQVGVGAEDGSEGSRQKKSSCKTSCNSSRHLLIPVPICRGPWTGRHGVQRAGFFEQSTAGKREGQMTAVMAAAVGGPVGAQVTAGSWNKRMGKICYM